MEICKEKQYQNWSSYFSIAKLLSRLRLRLKSLISMPFCGGRSQLGMTDQFGLSKNREKIYFFQKFLDTFKLNACMQYMIKEYDFYKLSFQQ